MNQQDLADAVGVSRSYITHIETGQSSNVGIDHVFSLANVLGVSVAYLLGITDSVLSEPDAVISEAYVVYEVDHPEDRRTIQRLLDDFTALGPEDRQYVIDLIGRLRRANTPRIIGNE